MRRADLGREVVAQLLGSGDRAMFEQGLELPGLGPQIPVLRIGEHRSHEGTLRTLRAQVGVDPETAAGECDDRPGLLGQILGHAVSDEDHVDVAGVVQLVPRQLSHADDGEPARLVHQAGGVEHLGRHARQGRAGLFEPIEPDQIPGGDPQILPLLPGHEGLGAAGVDRRPTVRIGQLLQGQRIGAEQCGHRTARRGHGHQPFGQGMVVAQAVRE